VLDKLPSKQSSDESIKSFEAGIKRAGNKLFLNTTTTPASKADGLLTAGGRLEGTSKAKGPFILNVQPSENKYEPPV
jgi:hypothetical protein